MNIQNQFSSEVELGGWAARLWKWASCPFFFILFPELFRSLREKVKVHDSQI